MLINLQMATTTPYYCLSGKGYLGKKLKGYGMFKSKITVCKPVDTLPRSACCGTRKSICETRTFLLKV